jgi:hypothetical protein
MEIQMPNFVVEQALISEYTDDRTCKCIQIPDHYPIVNVHLPYTMLNQTKPLKGSLVMVISFDNHKHYIIAVLREPSSTLNQDPNQVLNLNTQFRGNTLAPGEVFLQAAGTVDVGTGNDAFLYISNAGTVEISASDLTEQIIIGGEASDEQDHEIVVRAPNLFLESTLIAPVSVQSTLNWDTLNNLQLANQTVTTSGTASIEVPISELTMDILGDVVLRNTTAGIDKSFLKLDATSNVQLGNVTSQLQFSPTGNITLDGLTINLNQGINPAARQNDLTFSSFTQDPAFWQFIQNLFLIFNSHTHISAAPGNPTAPPIPLLVSYPTQMGGIISSGSATVKIG